MDQIELAIKSCIDAWNVHISRSNKLFKELTDEQLQKEVAPSRNTGVYLLGHLTAVHDALFPLYGIGEKLYPELQEPFLKNPDKSGLKRPPVKDLRNYWDEVNNKLSEKIGLFTRAQWFEKHTSINEEDFKKEPHRNRLNVLINRTNHLAYHWGQLVFLK